MSSIWFVKEPEALLDYTIDWSDWLAVGDTIASGVFYLLQSGLTIEDEDVAATTHTAWLSGGVDGQIYNVISHVYSTLGREDEKVFDIIVRNNPTELSKLLSRLRLHLGDMNSATYRYLDEWLIEALKGAVQALERRWNSKYIIDNDLNDIIRNPDFFDFVFDSPPVIQGKDIEPIILKASIIVKSGSLENTSWNLGRWQDAEISVSNIEGGKAKRDSIAQDILELDSMLPPPNKKLTKSTRISFDENAIV
jgi:hypothetical protein